MSEIAKCIVCGYFTKVYNWKVHEIEGTDCVKCPVCGEIIKCPWWLDKED